MGYIGHYGHLAEKTYEALRHFGKNNVELVLKKTKNDIFRDYKETLPDGKKAIMAMNKKGETFINKHFDDIPRCGNVRYNVGQLLLDFFG